MPRAKSIKALDRKIEEANARAVSLKKRLEATLKEIESLNEERDLLVGAVLTKARKSSNRTLDQVLTFIGK